MGFMSPEFNGGKGETERYLALSEMSPRIPQVPTVSHLPGYPEAAATP